MLKRYSLVFLTPTFLVLLLISSSCETKTTTPDKPNLFLQVVDQNDAPQDFVYKITAENKSINAVSDRAFGQAALKMEAPVSYDVEVNVGSYLETKKGVRWPANAAKVLRFEFNSEEGEFVLDADDNTPLDQIDENGITDAEKEKEKQKGIPPGWVEGRLYNSNNVSCQYAGKSLVFINQGSEILNITTGKISEGVIVPAGKSVAVAVSNRGGFFRALISTDSGNSEARGRSIAFVSLDNLFKGWWFAAGCEDGSKPATNCNDGNGRTDYGGSCKTLGEDY